MDASKLHKIALGSLEKEKRNLRTVISNIMDGYIDSIMESGTIQSVGSDEWRIALSLIESWVMGEIYVALMELDIHGSIKWRRKLKGLPELECRKNKD